MISLGFMISDSLDQSAKTVRENVQKVQVRTWTARIVRLVVQHSEMADTSMPPLHVGSTSLL